MELKHTIIREDRVGDFVVGDLYYPTSKLSHMQRRLLTSTYQEGYHYTSIPILLNKGDVMRLKTNASSQGIAWLWDDGYQDGKNAYIDEGTYSTEEGTWVTLTASRDNLPVTIMSSADTYSTLEVYVAREIPIEEPIGYDNLQVALERHDYHGIGAESSIGTLEFYGVAANIIEQVYNTDIETQLLYKITDNEGEELKWLIDLSTYTMKMGKYKSVSCKVCEEGIKTAFNNRTDIEVDLNESKDAEWKSVNIPTKHLLYTNKTIRKVDHTYTTGGGNINNFPDVGVLVGFGTNYSPILSVPIGGDDDVTNEFGTFTEGLIPYSTDYDIYIDPQYTPNEDHDEKYGYGTRTEVDIELKVTMQAQRNGTIWGDVDKDYMTWQLVAYDGLVAATSNKVRITYQTASGDHRKNEWSFTCKLKTTSLASKPIKYYLVCDMYLDEEPNRYMLLHVTVHKGSFVKMTMYDEIEEKPSYTDVIMVKDALDIVAGEISDGALSAKSDWYEYKSNIGGGALKSLTNGYKIRDLFTKDDNKRNMPISFKDMITNLNALDCVGWGFSNEDNQDCIRIERWDWFYRENQMLEIDDAEELTIETDTDRMITEFVVGYKKYATSDQYNSIESPHGIRVFTNNSKVVNKTLTKECEFIADNYVIEETRRDRFTKSETDSSSYDENMFVLEMIGQKVYTEDQDTGLGRMDFNVEIKSTATNAKNVGRVSEFINAKLTPRHMAARWKDYLFQMWNNQPLKFTSGEINYKSSFGVIPYKDALYEIYSLQTFEDSSPQIENEDITFNPSKLRAEKLSFSYPLTIAQYKAIKKDPYGLVKVNGVLGWIKIFKYSFVDGIAEFTLIPKNIC